MYNVKMEIEQVTSITEEIYEAFRRLIPQLTSTTLPPTKGDLDALIKSDSSILFIARYPDEKNLIIGAGCLTVYRVLTGVKGIIEDVIVDESARAHGIGESLIRHMLDFARNKGAKGVALTSNPKRISANQLYQRIGFVLRETNAYFFRF
jgi:GNAT superfamily N-acetyltransferase